MSDTASTTEPFVPSLVSVVIPAYNCADVIASQLDALAAQDYRGDWEIVVADNRSTDGTRAAAERHAPAVPVPVRVVDAFENQGVSHARNAGVAAATGDLILLADADDRAEPGWLSAMVAAAATLDVIGGWLDPTPLNDELTRSWRPVLPRDHLPIAENWLPYAVGANLGFRRSVVDRVGGFREDYARGGDDIEFCWRAQLRGLAVGAAPDAVMAYRFRSGLRSLFRQYEGYGLASPRLFRDHRHLGMPRSRARDVAIAYAQLVRDLPRALVDPVARGNWVRRAAFRWGRIKGSWHYKVIDL